MYNKSILIGRISNDLELRETNSGKSYCKFNLAVNRMNGGVDFIPVTVWNKQAENLVQYQKKGSLILVDGPINVGSYTDSEGNNRSTFEIVAQIVQFLEKKGNTSMEESQENEKDPYEEIGEQISIDDNFLED